jgi:hypothetical protein
MGKYDKDLLLLCEQEPKLASKLMKGWTAEEVMELQDEIDCLNEDYDPDGVFNQPHSQWVRWVRLDSEWRISVYIPLQQDFDYRETDFNDALGVGKELFDLLGCVWYYAQTQDRQRFVARFRVSADIYSLRGKLVSSASVLRGWLFSFLDGWIISQIGRGRDVPSELLQFFLSATEYDERPEASLDYSALEWTVGGGSSQVQHSNPSIAHGTKSQCESSSTEIRVPQDGPFAPGDGPLKPLRSDE